MKQNKKMWISLSLAITLGGTLLAGCSSSPAEKNNNGTGSSSTSAEKKTAAQPVTMRIGVSGNEKSHDYIGNVKFKELVEKYSNGAVQVQIFPNAQLGNDESMIKQMQTGALEASVFSTSPLANMVPDFGLFDLPFLFKDEKVADAVLTGPAGQSILDELPAQGLVGLTFWENGFRELSNSQHPIKTLDDLKGLKLRVMQSPIILDYWRALGANPTPMSFDQLFNALQQHVVDGQENPVQLIYSQKFYEVQKYVTLSNHMYSPLGFIVSKVWWDKLSPDQQQVIKKAAVEAGQYEREMNRKETTEDLKLLKEKGVQVDSLTDEELAKWREKVKPVIDKYSQKNKLMADKLFAAIKDAEAKEK